MQKTNRYLQYQKALGYTLKKDWILSVLFVVGLILSIITAVHYKKELFDIGLTVAEIMTLLVAVSIAIVNYNQEWRNSLPKTLSVHYRYRGKYYLSCYYADLTSEGDIRTWAQQIGQQMTGGGLLDFNPFFKLQGPEVITLQPSNVSALHYEVTILLKSPKFLRDPQKRELDLTQYQRWYVVHGKNHEEDQKLELKPIEPPAVLDQLSYGQALGEALNREEDAQPHQV